MTGGLARVDNPAVGCAEELPITGDPRLAATVSHWLISAWRPHPRQWLLGCYRLGGIPGWPPAYKISPGFTHELCLAAADPARGWLDPGRWDQAVVMARWPPPLRAQFTAADATAHALAGNAARAIITGAAPADTRTETTRRFWAGWLSDELHRLRQERN